MKYGYVCFSYSKNDWMAKAIAWFTKSQWSHSFITLPPMLGRDMAAEAALNGISAIPFDIAYRCNDNQRYEVYRFQMPKEDIDRGIIMTMDMLESSYGYFEYPWFIWRSINKFFGRDIKKNDNWTQQGTVCSGLVRMYIDSVSPGLFNDFGNDSANAQDVYDIVKSRPDLFVLIEFKV